MPSNFTTNPANVCIYFLLKSCLMENGWLVKYLAISPPLGKVSQKVNTNK